MYLLNNNIYYKLKLFSITTFILKKNSISLKIKNKQCDRFFISNKK